MADEKELYDCASDISHLQPFHLSGKNASLSALTSLEQLLDILEMTAAELEEMCGIESEDDALL